MALEHLLVVAGRQPVCETGLLLAGAVDRDRIKCELKLQNPDRLARRLSPPQNASGGHGMATAIAL
jgi:hypothetical protein